MYIFCGILDKKPFILYDNDELFDYIIRCILFLKQQITKIDGRKKYDNRYYFLIGCHLGGCIGF